MEDDGDKKFFEKDSEIIIGLVNEEIVADLSIIFKGIKIKIFILILLISFLFLSYFNKNIIQKTNIDDSTNIKPIILYHPKIYTESEKEVIFRNSTYKKVENIINLEKIITYMVLEYIIIGTIIIVILTFH